MNTKLFTFLTLLSCFALQYLVAQNNNYTVVANDLFFAEDLYKTLVFDDEDTEGSYVGLSGKISHDKVAKMALDKFLQLAEELDIAEQDISLAMVEGKLNPFFEYTSRSSAIKSSDLQLIWRGLATKEDLVADDMKLVSKHMLDWWLEAGYIDNTTSVPTSHYAIGEILNLKRSKLWNERFGDLKLQGKEVKSIFNGVNSFVAGKDLAARRAAHSYFAGRDDRKNKLNSLDGFPQYSKFTYNDIVEFLKFYPAERKHLFRKVEFYLNSICLYNYYEYFRNDYKRLRAKVYLPNTHQLPNGSVAITQFKDKELQLESERKKYESLSESSKRQYDMLKALKEVIVNNSNADYVFKSKDYWALSWANMSLPSLKLRQLYVDIPLIRAIADAQGKELNTEEENIELNFKSLVLFYRLLNEKQLLQNYYSKSDASEVIRAYYMEFVINYCSLCEQNKPPNSKEFKFITTRTTKTYGGYSGYSESSSSRNNYLYIHPKYLSEYEKYLYDGYTGSEDIDAYGTSDKSVLNYHVGFESVQRFIKRMIRTRGCKDKDVLALGDILLSLSKAN